MSDIWDAADRGREDVDREDRYASLRPTERERLEAELLEAVQARDRIDRWWVIAGVGPPALGAMGFAFFAGYVEMIPVIFGLGAGVQIWRVFNARQRIKQIRQALEDPMDGS